MAPSRAEDIPPNFRGLGEAVEALFGEPSTPTIRRREAFAQARARVPELPAHASWLASEYPVREGSVFTLDGARLGFPPSRGDGRWWVFFADPDPVAKWGHPATWVFVPAARWLDARRNVDDVVTAPGTMPPHGDGPVPFHTIDLGGVW